MMEIDDVILRSGSMLSVQLHLTFQGVQTQIVAASGGNPGCASVPFPLAVECGTASAAGDPVEDTRSLNPFEKGKKMTEN